MRAELEHEQDAPRLQSGDRSGSEQNISCRKNSSHSGNLSDLQSVNTNCNLLIQVSRNKEDNVKQALGEGAFLPLPQAQLQTATTTTPLSKQVLPRPFREAGQVRVSALGPLLLLLASYPTWAADLLGGTCLGKVGPWKQIALSVMRCPGGDLGPSP